MVDSLSHTLPFPAFAVDWVDAHNIVITGGGGASKTGVPNGVLLYLVRGGVERLVQRRFYQTGDELPYFAKALPSLDLLAVAIGNRVELLRLHNIMPLTRVLELAPDPNVMDPTMIIAFYQGTGTTGVDAPDNMPQDATNILMAVGAHDGHIRLLKIAPSETQHTEDVKSHESEGPPTVSQLGITPTATEKPYRDIAFHPSGCFVLGACEDGSWRAFWVSRGERQDHQGACPPAFTLVATSKGGMEGSTESAAGIVAKDQKQGIFYTCRCGKFSEDGRSLFTVHYVRRGPKNTDKRPVLTKWGVELRREEEQGGKGEASVSVRLVRSVCLAGVDPIMCIDLRGPVGVAGDCSGRTIIFQTRNLSWRAREKMHNFGVTSLSFYPAWSLAGPPHASTVREEDVRIASTSGDKTLRLQYLQASRQDHKRMGWIRWSCSFILWLFSTVVYLLLFVLVLLGLMVALALVWDVPPDRVFDQFLAGVYEPTVWQPAVAQVQVLCREGLAVLRVSQGYVQEKMGPWVSTLLNRARVAITGGVEEL
ncbi:hypothetical protein NSK_007590 [Nannochloropsis salina CCMP1776]|uniref:Uncharacterized protein n=1 Tax=Nannochloropsis salina CCMP1776 TaxID=1027361 RepID=A0A4D9CSD1_9STRA|nr:hypothetical protein NSK_007590 [Nannochloropsis salina CCMP1776]|eukprot:TFJ80947.1 hypothetical protein NSK_007590 [Nannochloropsis salina CCMP1776]